MGVSGAGKTTLGTLIKKYLDEKNIKNYMIDGDEIRSLFDNDLGYTTEDRKLNVKRIMLGAYLLEKNGIVPIVCNIHPFEELRQLARTKLNDYHQIFINKQVDENYTVRGNVDTKNIVGKDIQFDYPENSDLTVNVGEMSIEESFEMIKKYVEEKNLV